MDQQRRAAKLSVLFLFGKLTGKSNMSCQLRLIGQLPQLSFRLASAHDGQMRFDPSLKQDSCRLKRMIDALVDRQP